jgi:hypothetical protein
MTLYPVPHLKNLSDMLVDFTTNWNKLSCSAYYIITNFDCVMRILYCHLQKMSTYKVEVVPSPLSVLGEAPHWDIERQCLYYNDIFGGSIHRYDYKEDKTYNATIGDILFLLN